MSSSSRALQNNTTQPLLYGTQAAAAPVPQRVDLFSARANTSVASTVAAHTPHSAAFSIPSTNEQREASSIASLFAARDLDLMGAPAASTQARYRVDTQQVLGSGTYAVVCRGVRVDDGQTCAIKLMRVGSQEADEQQRAAYLRETHAAVGREYNLQKLCTGPFVPGVFDLLKARNSAGEVVAYAFVMEYLPRGNVREALGQPGRAAPPLLQRELWFTQLMCTLVNTHRHGVAHRDIKPANMLLDADNIAHLGDFGFAAQFNTSDTSAFRLGTPDFMGPEINGTPYAPLPAGIFAAGMALYQLVWRGEAGKHPKGKLGVRTNALSPSANDTFYRHLITGMLAPTPLHRPTAMQVLCYPRFVELLTLFWQQVSRRPESHPQRAPALTHIDELRRTVFNATQPRGATTLPAATLEAQCLCLLHDTAAPIEHSVRGDALGQDYRALDYKERLRVLQALYIAGTHDATLIPRIYQLLGEFQLVFQEPLLNEGRTHPRLVLMHMLWPLVWNCCENRGVATDAAPAPPAPFLNRENFTLADALNYVELGIRVDARNLGALRVSMAHHLGEEVVTFRQNGKTTYALRYNGAWQNGRWHGRGEAYFPEGQRYDGEWHQGKRQGQGTMRWNDGRVYSGHWHDDKPHGVGEWCNAEGTSYRGEWHLGQEHGNGVELKDGMRYQGRWRSGIKHGDFIYTNFQGVRVHCEWIDGDQQVPSEAACPCDAHALTPSIGYMAARDAAAPKILRGVSNAGERVRLVHALMALPSNKTGRLPALDQIITETMPITERLGIIEAVIQTPHSYVNTALEGGLFADLSHEQLMQTLQAIATTPQDKLGRIRALVALKDALPVATRAADLAKLVLVEHKKLQAVARLPKDAWRAALLAM